MAPIHPTFLNFTWIGRSRLVRTVQIGKPLRAHVTAKRFGFGSTQNVLRGCSSKLSGEFIVADFMSHSQAQFGLRTEVASVLHGASIGSVDDVRLTSPTECTNAGRYALIFQFQLFKIERARTRCGVQN
jgi:hypothetical protein